MSGPHDPALGHETRDVRLTPVVIATALIAALVLVSAFGMMGLFDALAAREARRSAPANPLAGAVSKVPPEPRLQERPIEDLHALRAAESRLLGGYSWVDRDAGVARIPIDRAMELTVQRYQHDAGGRTQ
jgi:hypothetical protein